MKVISIKNDYDDYLSEYIQLCKEEWGNSINEEIDNYINRKKNQIRSGDKVIEIFALLDKNVMIGFLSLFLYDGEERRELSPWYATMYIKKEYRKMGYSKILHNALMKYLEENGYSKVYLKSSLSGYYEKFGANYMETLRNGEKLYFIDVFHK